MPRRLQLPWNGARALPQETLSESHSTALQSFERATLLGDHALCARALTLQGDIATHRGDLRDAARLAFEAERHVLEADDPRAMVEIAGLRSHIYFFTGSYAQALSYADHAISIADRSSDQKATYPGPPFGLPGVRQHQGPRLA